MDQVLDLRGLGRHLLVRGREDVGGRHYVVLHRLLRDDVIALEHRLTPRIAGIVVGEGDFLVAGVGVGGCCANRARGGERKRR